MKELNDFTDYMVFKNAEKTLMEILLWSGIISPTEQDSKHVPLGQLTILAIFCIIIFIDMDKPVHIILTGGTIDSHWQGAKDTAVTLEHSAIPEFVKNLQLYATVRFSEVCMKDSRDINQGDREKILRAIQESSEEKIIVTHGTYTMPDTARYLETNLGDQNKKTIILTGSMIPLTGFAPSDASFNLGFAMAKLQDTAAGVYIAMNGRVFLPKEVLKLWGEGRFSSMFSN